MSYSSTILGETGLVAYWRLGEASGNPQDSQGTNHVTSVGGSPTYETTGLLTGDANKAMTFSGTGQYLSVPDATALDLGNGPLTLEAWVKPSSTAAVGAIVGKLNGAYYMRMASGGAIDFVKSQTSVIVGSTATMTAGNVYHVVCTKSGTSSVIYLNGSDVSGGVTDATLVDNAIALGIGSEGGSGAFDPFPGVIDEVAIYNVALTSTQVAAHYTAGTTNPSPTWTTPADTVSMSTTPELKFNSPSSAVAQHFYLQLDTANTFATGNLRTYRSDQSQTNWDYWNGSAWTAFPSTGLASTYAGNEIRYTVTSALSAATWYRRVRAGTGT